MFFVSYWILPLISALMWLGMLLAMLTVWITEGSPHYASMSGNQHIAYISDIGAQHLKPLFIAGSVVTTIFLDASFLAERWLRHTGRLAKNTTMAEKVLSGLAILFAVVGTCGLILLSNFDTLHYPRLHDGFLLLFIAGYVICAIFICAEYQRLGTHLRQYSILRISFWIKLFFIIVEIALAIAFATTAFTGHQNVAAVLEWIIALIFTAWVLSFFMDLLPSIKTKHGEGGEGFNQVEVGRPDHNGNDVYMNEANGANRYSNGYAMGNGAQQTNGNLNGYGNGAYKEQRRL